MLESDVLKELPSEATASPPVQSLKETHLNKD